MLLGSRLFVAIIFSSLAAAFWLVTIQLYLEFAHATTLADVVTNPPTLSAVATAFTHVDQQTWFLLLTHYSDLFLFFPVFGTIALFAFFKPATLLVDIYWNRDKVPRHLVIPFAKLRFSIGLVAIVALSFYIAYDLLDGGERTLWQLKPSVLKTDRGIDCTADDTCQRVAFLDAIKNIRRTSRERVLISDLNRNCRRDWFIEPPRTAPSARYCPVTTNIRRDGSDIEGKWLGDAACCQAQRRFDMAVKARYEQPANRSATHLLQSWLWPAHIFFLLTLLMISGLLAFRRKRIEELYPDYSRAIDRGVMIGGIAMLPLPLMHNGFLLTTKLAHGDGGSISLHRIPETFTIAFGLWALLIIVSFLHPAHKQAESIGRIFGVIASVLFALKGDTVTDYTIYMFGAGAGVISLAIMLAIAAGLLLALWIWRRAETGPSPDDMEPASANPFRIPYNPARNDHARSERSDADTPPPLP